LKQWKKAKEFGGGSKFIDKKVKEGRIYE